MFALLDISPAQSGWENQTNQFSTPLGVEVCVILPVYLRLGRVPLSDDQLVERDCLQETEKLVANGAPSVVHCALSSERTFAVLENAGPEGIALDALDHIEKTDVMWRQGQLVTSSYPLERAEQPPPAKLEHYL
jgi:hypothetical protein